MEDNLHITPARRVSNYILAAICVAAGCVTTMMLIDCGMPGSDETYQTICVRDYLKSPLGLLIYWIGHWWTELFGFTVLNLRILTSIEFILASAVTSCWLYLRTRDIRLSSVLFLLSCIMLRAGAHYLYNWDTGTYLFDAVALCLLMSVLSRPTAAKCLLLGAVIALMMLGRATSGIFLPVAATLVYIAVRKTGNHGHTATAGLRMAAIIVIGWAVCILTLTTAICGSPAAYLDSFSEQTVVTGHNPVKDIHMLWGRLAEMTLMLPDKWFFGVMCIVLAAVLPAVTRRRNRILILLPWLMICLLTSYWHARSTPTIAYRLGLDTPLGLGLLLAVPIYRLYDRRAKFSRLCGLRLWACGLAVVSYSFGSDSFHERMVTAFTLPVIVGVLWNENNQWVRGFTRWTVIVSILSFGTLYYTHYMMISRYFRTMPPSDMPVVGGLRDAQMADMLQTVKEMDSVARRLDLDRKRFVYLGDYKKLQLIYGYDPGVPIHMYHYSWASKQDWDTYKGHYASGAEYVIYDRRIWYEDRESILADVRAQGYTDSITYGEIVVLRRPETATHATPAE